ncbi:phage minor head protein [Ferruginibacter yonginensis]|uniref:Phage minor head protein n=1 Tax=Ferruginibacter yonginensis TaxID=1310416 RepID=A0ABV8QQA1_9BACT
MADKNKAKAFNKKVFDSAVAHLHKKGKIKPAMLADAPIKALTDETNSILKDAIDFTITDNEVPATMLNKLRNDVYLFSGFKTYSQLKTASELLLDENGKRKPFATFAADVEAIHANYNMKYLEAEYFFAVGSAQMAAKWAGIDEGGRYNLQYRTAGDSRVRESHSALRNITLPATDDFWNSYYPPNGWRCRCTVVEVLKDKYDVSDADAAIKAGEDATTQIGKDGNNTLDIFRFNPGKQSVIFPPKHPYRAGKSEEKKEVLQVLNKQSNERLAQRRNEIKALAKENIVGKKVTVKGIDGKINFGMNGIKEALNQGHKFYEAKNEALLDIQNLIKNGTYIGSAEDSKNRVKLFHYVEVEIAANKSYVVIKETEKNEFHFYSIVDKIKKGN